MLRSTIGRGLGLLGGDGFVAAAAAVFVLEVDDAFDTVCGEAVTMAVRERGLGGESLLRDADRALAWSLATEGPEEGPEAHTLGLLTDPVVAAIETVPGALPFSLPLRPFSPCLAAVVG